MQKRMIEFCADEQERIRANNRERERKSRANQRALAPMDYDEVVDTFPEEKTTVLSEYVNEVLKQVKSELEYPFHAEETLHYVAWTLFAFKKGWVQQVHTPRGEFVGGTYFADVIGSHVVAGTHRYGLEKSQTFSTLYRELLHVLDDRYGKTLSEDPIEKRAALDVKAELAGEYVPPEQALPKQ